jgi:curved DNA-binding protein CbpA
MGQGVSSLNNFEPSHVRIYKSILQIENPQTRLKMIQTVIQGPEYIQSAKAAGIYSHLLSYIAQVRSGEAPAPLPGELGKPQPTNNGRNEIIEHKKQVSDPSTQVLKQRGNEKAMNYFQNCLLVLELEEEVALTEELLRKAYKKAAVKAHPDKGGSQQKFEAVTRAYAYLTDILHRIQGGRTKAGVVEAPTILKDSRATSAKDWEMIKPVKLNPKKLDMNTFNQMYEQTRIPDPDDEGYGDWLASENATSKTSKTFSEKFNRDVFNRAFEDETKNASNYSANQHNSIVAPKAMTLAPTHGVELGRTSAGDYTAPANAQMKYTDLKQAYTTENTFSNQVSNIQVDSRSFDTYSASRKKAPEPLTNSEMEALNEAERHTQRQEQQRSLRAAQELVHSDEYFRRMKQMVLMDTTSMAKKSDRY